MAKKKRGDRPKRPSPLDELRGQLDAMKQDPTASQVRLRADLARDTAEELFGKIRRQMRRQALVLRKLQEQSDKWRTRLTDLLHELATGPVILPRASGDASVTHEQLAVIYNRLKGEAIPALAQTLHDAAGTSTQLPAYQRFLVEEILIKGGLIVAEHLVREAGARTPADEEQFIERLRDHVAGNVCQALARMVKYQVTPEVGRSLAAVIDTALHWLHDLLTATPPGRLLVPRDEDPFDPERHEVMPGRPATGELKVTATLFPGYVVLSEPPRVQAKAVVYTERRQEAG